MATRSTITDDELHDLPPVFPWDIILPKAFGMSRTATYCALRDGELYGLKAERIRGRLMIRKVDLLRALGVDEPREQDDELVRRARELVAGWPEFSEEQRAELRAALAPVVEAVTI